MSEKFSGFILLTTSTIPLDSSWKMPLVLPDFSNWKTFLSSKGIDSSNNFSFGIKEHIIFPEVNFDKVDKIRGLDITITIKNQDKEHSFELLKQLNFPFIEKRSN